MKMHKSVLILLSLLVVSCGKKRDVLLPQAFTSVVTNVIDHSPIYIFFTVNGKDTIAEVNRKNSIISTNWLFNIDKRLPLRLVIPEVMKLQTKKRGESAHKNEKAENYYSYADTVHKSLAFLPFTNVFYKLSKPNRATNLVYCKKNGELEYNGQSFKNFDHFIAKNSTNSENRKTKLQIAFDSNMKFGDYVTLKIKLFKLNSKSAIINFDQNQEFIY